MGNIIDFITAVDISSSAGVWCWLCQKPVSLRAIFCHHCGTIQPVRDIDHFERLGIERRVDIDFEALEKQYSAMKKTLDPQRFAIRGMGERNHAAKQLEALEAAYETLRDPVRRGRYWLELHEHETETDGTRESQANDLLRELKSAANVCQCDMIAARAGQAIEKGIISLMQALRENEWQRAKEILSELDGMENVLREAREIRTHLTVSANSNHEQ